MKVGTSGNVGRTGRTDRHRPAPVLLTNGDPMTPELSERDTLGSIPRAPDEGPDLGRLPIQLRPNESLMTYYLVTSLLLGPFFLLLLIPRFFRYRTLRYRIDDEGIAMQWGILFHREVSLSYARIQDIHLSSNLVERRFGLGRIEIQTASASAGAEMRVEGIPGLERMRDFLYGRMRGARGRRSPGPGAPSDTGAPGDRSREGRGLASGEVPAGMAGGAPELAQILHTVAEEIRALRRELVRDGSEATAPGSGESHDD